MLSRQPGPYCNLIVSDGTVYSMEWSLGVGFWSGVLDIRVERSQILEWQK